MAGSLSGPSDAMRALDMAEAAWNYFNSEDLAGLPLETVATCMRRWHRVEAKQIMAGSRLVAAFDAGDGAAADGQRSTAAWLARFGRITLQAARRWRSRGRRLLRHEHVAAAMTAGSITDSYGQWICDVVAKFPPADRDDVEKILADAASSDATIEDLVTLAAQMYRILVPNGPEDDEDLQDDKRQVTLGKTLNGVGRLNGDLNRRATALAEQVINALAVKKGPEDMRSAPQRRHDALAEAFQRLVDSDLLPQRGGAKPNVRVDMPLVILRGLRGARQAEAEWLRAKLADLARPGHSQTRDLGDDAHPRGREERGAAATETAHATRTGHHTETGDAGAGDSAADGGTGDPESGSAGMGDSAVLAGIGPISDRLADTLSCNGTLTPTVTGHVDGDALTAMTDYWLSVLGLHPDGKAPEDHGAQAGRSEAGQAAGSEAAGHEAAGHRAAGHEAAGHAAAGSKAAGSEAAGSEAASSKAAGHGHQAAGRAAAGRAAAGHETAARAVISPEVRRHLQRRLLRWAVDVLSGPTGLASQLRRRAGGAPLDSPSIVLDVGSDIRNVPAPIERAVRARDGRCRFPGCDHPAELSQVHHIVHRQQHGPTSLTNLIVLCSFHHLIAVHTWKWQISLNPDGTVTATSPSGGQLHDSGLPGSQPPVWAA